MSRRVRIYDPNGPIGGRRCTEHASKKQVATEHFRGSGRHKYIKKRCKQGGIEALATSVSYSLLISILGFLISCTCSQTKQNLFSPIFVSNWLKLLLFLLFSGRNSRCTVIDKGLVLHFLLPEVNRTEIH